MSEKNNVHNFFFVMYLQYKGHNKCWSTVKNIKHRVALTNLGSYNFVKIYIK